MSNTLSPEIAAILARIKSKVPKEGQAEEPETTAKELLQKNAEWNAKGIPQHEKLRSLLMQGAMLTEAMRAVVAAQSWQRLNRLPFLLVLSGVPGCGKTVALARWIADSNSGCFVRASEIAQTPRNDWSENSAKWKRWSIVRKLAVDEFGLEERAVGARLNALLCDRFDNGLETILATNADEQTVIESLFDPRLASRVLGEQGFAGRNGGLPFFAILPAVDMRVVGGSNG